MDLIKTLLKIIGLVLFASVFFTLLTSILIWMFCIVFFFWAIGTRITVSQSGVKIGFIRWFTFYKV